MTTSNKNKIEIIFKVKNNLEDDWEDDTKTYYGYSMMNLLDILKIWREEFKCKITKLLKIKPVKD